MGAGTGLGGSTTTMGAGTGLGGCTTTMGAGTGLGGCTTTMGAGTGLGGSTTTTGLGSVSPSTTYWLSLKAKTASYETHANPLSPQLVPQELMSLKAWRSSL